MTTDVLHRMRELLVELGVSPEVSRLCEDTLRHEYGGDATWIGRRPKARALHEIASHPELDTTELARRLGLSTRRVRQLRQLSKQATDAAPPPPPKPPAK